MTPGQIKALIVTLLALGVAVGGYFAVSAYNGAIAKAATLEKSLKDAADANAQMKDRITQLEADRKADAAALEAKEEERKAYAKLLAETVKDYRHDLKQIQEVDRACAGRTVPAPVDRLLSKNAR